MHNEDYRIRPLDDCIHIEYYRNSPPAKLERPQKSVFEAVLLVAPEVQQELVVLIDKMLSAATMLASPVIIHRDLGPRLNKPMCVLSLLRQQLTGGHVQTTLPALSFPAIRGYLYGSSELDILTTQEMILEACMKYDRAVW